MVDLDFDEVLAWNASVEALAVAVVEKDAYGMLDRSEELAMLALDNEFQAPKLCSAQSVKFKEAAERMLRAGHYLESYYPYFQVKIDGMSSYSYDKKLADNLFGVAANRGCSVVLRGRDRNGIWKDLMSSNMENRVKELG